MFSFVSKLISTLKRIFHFPQIFLPAKHFKASKYPQTQKHPSIEIFWYCETKTSSTNSPDTYLMHRVCRYQKLSQTQKNDSFGRTENLMEVTDTPNSHSYSTPERLRSTKKAPSRIISWTRKDSHISSWNPRLSFTKFSHLTSGQRNKLPKTLPKNTEREPLLIFRYCDTVRRNVFDTF